MKNYEKDKLLEFTFPQIYWEEVELCSKNGEIWLSIFDEDYVRDIDITEQKLIELRNFINTLLEEA